MVYCREMVQIKLTRVEQWEGEAIRVNAKRRRPQWYAGKRQDMRAATGVGMDGYCADGKHMDSWKYWSNV
jgi:hypothetical protein